MQAAHRSASLSHPNAPWTSPPPLSQFPERSDGVKNKNIIFICETKKLTYEWKSQPYGLDSLDHFREHFAAKTLCHMALPVRSLFYSFFCLSPNTITFVLLPPSCNFIRVAKQSTRHEHFHLKCTRDATTLIRFEWIFGKLLASGCVFVYGVPYRDFHMCLEISVLQSVPILYSLPFARFSFDTQVLSSIHYINIKFKSENKLGFSFAEGVLVGMVTYGCEHFTFSRQHLCAIAIEQRCSADVMNCTR